MVDVGRGDTLRPLIHLFYFAARTCLVSQDVGADPVESVDQDLSLHVSKNIFLLKLLLAKLVPKQVNGLVVRWLKQSNRGSKLCESSFATEIVQGALIDRDAF